MEDFKDYPELHTKTHGLYAWFRQMDVEIASFAIAFGTSEEDPFTRLPYCHDAKVIERGGRWRYGMWAPPNCIVAKHAKHVASKLLHGVRVRIMGDSNFQHVMAQFTRFICGDGASSAAFFENGNNCPLPQESMLPFSFAWRFFRFVSNADQLTDYILSEDAQFCTKGLFPDHYNVTIMMLGLWQLATKESGYPQTAASHLRNVLTKCEPNLVWPDGKTKHLLMLQDVGGTFPRPNFGGGAWRRCHNHDILRANRDQQQILQSRYSGAAIPTFEMALAVPKSDPRDPFHGVSEYYEAMMHLMIDSVYIMLENHGNKAEERGASNDYWFLDASSVG